MKNYIKSKSNEKTTVVYQLQHLVSGEIITLNCTYPLEIPLKTSNFSAQSSTKSQLQHVTKMHAEIELWHQQFKNNYLTPIIIINYYSDTQILINTIKLSSGLITDGNLKSLKKACTMMKT